MIKQPDYMKYTVLDYAKKTENKDIIEIIDKMVTWKAVENID